MAEVVDLHRIRVGQGGRRLDLALEAAQVLRVAGALGADELEGAGPPQERVLREIDLTHAAFTEFLFQHVLAQFARLAYLPAQDLDPRTRHDRDDRGEGDEERDLEQTN